MSIFVEARFVAASLSLLHSSDPKLYCIARSSRTKLQQSRIGREHAQFRTFDYLKFLDGMPSRRRWPTPQGIGYPEPGEEDHDGGNPIWRDWGGDMLRHALPRA